MKVTSQTLDNRQIALTVEVEDERVQDALHRAAKRISNNTNIPGYRKGKAPYNVVLRAVGEEALYEEAVEDLGQKLYREALDEAELEPYGPGQMNDVQIKPMVFKFTVPLRPSVDLGDYRSLRAPYTPPEVSEESVDEVLHDIQERNSVMEPAGEGPAEMGQVAVVSIDAKLDPNSDELVLHEQDINLAISDETDFPFPGVIQNVVGMKTGEEKSFEMTVPDTFDIQDWRGKPIYFTVKLNDLKVRRVPPLDDALAQTFGDYETLADLRESIRKSLLQQAAQEADAKYGDTCTQQLADQATIEFPPQMVEEELDDMIDRTRQRLSDQKMSLDEFLNIKKQSMEDYRKELRPRAEKSVRRALALGKLGDEEKIDVTDAEVEAQIQGISERYSQDAQAIREQLSTEQGKRSIALNLLTAKILARLVSICKGENPPLPAADETPAPSEPEQSPTPPTEPAAQE